MTEWSEHAAVRPFLAEYKANTKVAYGAVLCRSLFHWIAEAGNDDPVGFCLGVEKLLLAEELRAWQKEQEDRGLAEATVSLRTSVVKLWFKFLRDSDLRTDDPSWRLECPTVWLEKQHTPAWSREELRRLRDALIEIRGLDVALAYRDTAAFCLMGLMGLRGFEACSLRWDDIADGRIRFVGKGNKPASLSIGGEVQHALDALRPLSRGAFVLGGIRRQTLSDIIRCASRHAGITVAGCHTLRRSFVTIALADGVPLAEVQLAARHKDPAMTMRYNARRDADVILSLEKAA